MDEGQCCTASEPPPRGNEAGPASSPTAESIITVQTANFHRVLDHFNSDGNLIDDKRTRLSIPCSICLLNDLSLINPHLEESADITHEHYTVLMRCGHAFGYKCLTKWFIVQRLNELRCPLCRAPAFCEQRHITPLEVYGGTTDMEVQCQQIKEIRRNLNNPTCEECSSLNSNNHPPIQTGDPMTAPIRVELEETNSRFLEAQGQAIHFDEQIVQGLQGHILSSSPLSMIGSNFPLFPQITPDGRIYRRTASIDYTPALGGQRWRQPTNERRTQSVTLPPTARGNNEDRTGPATLTFGHPYFQSLNRFYWEL
ncbi:hypothetical protein F4801DRAFT_578013 [Xylaria longipes]|nr:hypothetical protein F4801DRAFT_578013 [Xylaria longipes]RYC62256.1 hypothetical protein CHU98_g3951 [Xylaria longipes]